MGELTLAVVGLHLRGEPRNGELTDRGALFVRETRTAAAYRLFHLPSGAPGLLRQPGGSHIDIELWDLPLTEVGHFLDGIPAPLTLGRVELEDGTDVTGFLCEAYATAEAEDITASGGWRNHRRGHP